MIKYSFNLIFTLFSILIVSSISANSWSDKDIQQISAFTLKKLQPVKDPSNKYLLDKNVISLGEKLFSDTRLSSNKKISCASCHIKEKSFTDNHNLAVGLQKGFRNTPTLLNSAHHNWFFADGSKDSLWAQVLSSIENPAEQNFTRVELFNLFINDNTYKTLYESVFKQSLTKTSIATNLPAKAGPNADLQGLIEWKKLNSNQRDRINLFFTNIGKSIASYVTTLESKESRFDKFAYELSVTGRSSLLNKSEINGYKLFIDQKSGCSNCHNGPLFTNKEFHNIGTGILAYDNGRSEVINAVIHDEFNCLSKYSDAKKEECVELNYINRNKHGLSGAFKTPSLRNLSKTAPYMHDGRFSNLEEVLKYYSSIDEKRALEVDLPPISLTVKEQQDIVNFLLTL
ncbi:hypothetical protein OO007_03860 [Cocleimonas sp. KMM 6892]|uniref:cytochrome-c peroxidase n=1 Tax=unclassified Cocleimonas TaxID=2639732 RepID=UPI002DBEC6FC|nr:MULTISPECIES: cytochrome c peroxidase [unclassified Cocleimonas]MEB8431350.1 hypothetical protein [Cocleimonas sp. KMM 6892]MEC4713878.1 hypothetical protein [Cocleimonas sp. KMM 6895]MEC4743209.1 hypothetical protein [Cocleimonas sp. KMM 6896]